MSTFSITRTFKPNHSTGNIIFLKLDGCSRLWFCSLRFHQFLSSNSDTCTWLPLAGVTSLQTLQSPDNSIQPDFYTNQLSDFLTLKAATV